MAVLKDLIVHGNSKFLNGASFNTINAESIGAEEGIFNKLIATTLDAKTATIDDLTAQNATVVGLLDVQGELHTNAWTNANIANIGGSFYISPTVEPTDGTTTISITRNSATSWTVSASGTFATDFIKSGTATSGVAWPANSLVLITGDVVVGNMVYPLGTLKGTLSAQVTATTASTSKTITITGVTDAQNSNAPSVLQELYEVNNNANISNAAFKKGKISLYKLGSNPIGILLSSMGASSNSIIDIYGGVKTDPTVRIGHLAGLPAVNGTTPTGWGIYTDNGYFSGVIVSTNGKIGGYTLDDTSLYSGTKGNSTTSGHFTLTTGTFTRAIDGTSRSNLQMALGAKFGVANDGTLYANGANITSINAGNITAGDIAAARIQTNLISAINAKVSDLSALSATIGGFKVDSASIHTNNVAITSNADNSIALSSTDFTRTINSVSREGLRFALGDKFGVTGDGTLYANGANITNINANNISTNMLSAMQAVVSNLSVLRADMGTITAGVIKHDTVGGTNGIWFSAATDTSSNVTVGNSEARKDWRLLVNNKFGVTSDGILYASGAVISGDFNVTTNLGETYNIDEKLQNTNAVIEAKIDKVETASGLDLISNIRAVANQITLSANQINFTEDGSSTVASELGNLTSAISINTQNPSIRIGKTEHFYILITDTEMGFYQRGVIAPIAYMNGSELYVKNSLSFGRFVFTQRDNNHFTLKLID